MKRLLEILKIPGIIIGFAITIIGGYKYLESIPQRVEATVKVYSDSTNARFDKTDERIKTLTETVDGSIIINSALNKSYVRHLEIENKLDIIIDYQKELLKKNETSMNQIPYENLTVQISK